jgi:hypothetical protein
VNARHVAQTVRGGVEQGSQDARSRDLELTPELPLHPSPTVGDGWQCQEKGAIGEVGPADDIVNAIEKNRARRLKQHLVCVRVELAQSEVRARGEPAKRVR